MRIVTVLALFGVSLCSIAYAGEMDCHAHYRKGYRIKHCTPKSELIQHLKDDPIYAVHDSGYNDFRDSDSSVDAESKSERFKEHQIPIETEPKIKSEHFNIEIYIVPWIEKKDEHEKRQQEKSDSEPSSI